MEVFTRFGTVSLRHLILLTSSCFGETMEVISFKWQDPLTRPFPTHIFPPSDEMKTFAGQQIEPLFQFSWLVVFLTLLLCGSVALVLGFTGDPKLAIAVSLSLLALLYIFFSKEEEPLALNIYKR